jgi:limonene-1,2-epoxide hydrolase
LKNPANPSGDGADDPLNIVDVIRAVSPGVMAGMNYEYYFTDDAEFQDYQLVTIRGREIITMLERLRSLSPQSLRVEWQITNKWPDGNLYYLDNVQYTIYSNGARTHGGTAYFRILDDKISYWKDVPNGAQFFEN